MHLSKSRAINLWRFAVGKKNTSVELPASFADEEMFTPLHNPVEDDDLQ